MAQRKRGSSAAPAKGSVRGSRKVVVAPVKKSFPWGFAAGVAVLVLALVGIIGYAVANTGSGFVTAADRVDAKYDTLRVVENAGATHVAGPVDYPDKATQPPNSGDHSDLPQTCQVYDAPIPSEHAVHSMEHGAMWITYRPDLPADQVQVLRGLVEGDPYRMLSPYPGQTAAVSLQAWGRTLVVDSASDPQVEQFVQDYTNGPQAREPGAVCAGNDQPGAVPVQAAG